MTGFGICLWYRISSLDGLQRIQQKILKELKLDFFPIHVTLKMNIKETELQKMYYKYFSKQYNFIVVGEAYTTTSYIKGWSKSFNCIEIPLINKDTGEKYHISLGYRNGTVFNEKELKIVKNIMIEYNDLLKYGIQGSIHIYNASNEDFNKWSLIN